jgi:hypothetical protein
MVTALSCLDQAENWNNVSLHISFVAIPTEGIFYIMFYSTKESISVTGIEMTMLISEYVLLLSAWPIYHTNDNIHKAKWCYTTHPA